MRKRTKKANEVRACKESNEVQEIKNEMKMS
jgi:hypothetical protein